MGLTLVTGDIAALREINKELFGAAAVTQKLWFPNTYDLTDQRHEMYDRRHTHIYTCVFTHTNTQHKHTVSLSLSFYTHTDTPAMATT